jgi:3-hydroxybutyryl-CoA dehydrogenase
VSSSEAETKPEKIAVIGSGTMGAGIAQVVLLAGYRVTLQDLQQEVVEADRTQSARCYRRMAEKGQLESVQAEAAIARLSVTTDLTEAAQDTVWVIEAIFENMEAKRDLFSRLNQLCPPQTCFASNTSGLSISEIGAAGGRPGRTVGMHFFNPVPLMKLVEVVRGSDTEPAVEQAALELGQKLGKTVVICSDSPNFIVNRINRPVSLEAQQLLQDGLTAQTIDRALVQGAGFKMGPLMTGDLSGVHIGLTVTENVFKETGDPRFRPVPYVRQMVRAGYTGKKAGKGYYLYPPGAEGPVPRQPDIALPRQVAPAKVAVWGGSPAARQLKNQLAQAGCPPENDYEQAGLILIGAEAGQDYQEIFNELKSRDRTEVVYAILDPLASVTGAGFLSGQPGKVVGLHNPLPFVEAKFYELSLGLESGPEAAGTAAALLEKIGGKYVVAPETPAGIVLRVICAMINEAAFALQENLASVEDIDISMRLGMNYGLGPCEYADGLGIARVLAVLDCLHRETGDPRYRAAVLLRQMVRAGKSGQASGRGFYDYAY